MFAVGLRVSQAQDVVVSWDMQPFCNIVINIIMEMQACVHVVLFSPTVRVLYFFAIIIIDDTKKSNYFL